MSPYHHTDETCPCRTCSRLADLLEIASYDDEPTADERDELERDMAAAEALSEWYEMSKDAYRDEPMTDFEEWRAGEVIEAPRVSAEAFEEAEAAAAKEEEAAFSEWLKERKRAG